MSVCRDTLVYCIHMAEDIVKLLSRSSSPIILVFDPGADTQFKGEPVSGMQHRWGWENLAIFDGNHRLSRNDTR